MGDISPDLDDAELLKGFFTAIQNLRQAGLLFAYHDRSDGGLLATVSEMMFAAHCGVDLQLQTDDLIAELFNEELGAVIQVPATELNDVVNQFVEQGLANAITVIGQVSSTDSLTISNDGEEVYNQSRMLLQRRWSEVSYRMQTLRDNSDCAEQEYAALLDN